MQPTVARNESMDVIRGFAVLGIFLMNIMAFGMPWPAYFNPAYYGGATGSDLWVWYVQDALFDGRMRALFAMLFGAGIVLAVDRAKRAGTDAGARLAWRHLWLAAFGLAHVYLLQMQGDILWPYAVCGLVIWVFATLPLGRLILLALLVLAADSALSIFSTTEERQRYSHGVALQERASVGEDLSDSDQKQLDAWQEEFKSQKSSGWEEGAAKQLSGMRQPGWLAVYRFQADELRSASAISLEWLEYAGLMLFGMALGRWGFFLGERTARTYWLIGAAGFLVAAPFSHWMSRIWASQGFTLLPSEGDLTYVITARGIAILIGLAWASALIVAVKSGALGWMRKALAAPGRMAFTCYLSQTVIATLVFNGYGLGLYGQLSRTQLALVVVAVWISQIFFCRVWLRYFRYGPAEWAWRCLSYRELFPIRSGG